MSETRQEQIERLKRNNKGFYALTDDDKDLLQRLLDEQRSDIVFRSNIRFTDKMDEKLYGASIYRIHHDYQPEPDKPEFPGYVLCEVRNTIGWIQFYYHKLETWKSLDLAVRFNCCGYVPKEKVGGEWIRACVPIIFTDRDKMRVIAAFSDRGVEFGAQRLELGWVLFKDEAK